MKRFCASFDCETWRSVDAKAMEMFFSWESLRECISDYWEHQSLGNIVAGIA
jgi:hypothetical protein